MSEVDMQTGEVLWKRGLPHPTALGVEAECQWGLSWGAVRPNGGTVFGTCEHEIVFYSDDPAHDVTVFAAPGYVEEFPNKRDVHIYRTGMRVFYRDGSVPDVEVQRYAETPKQYTLAGQRMIYDSGDRLWIATQRDRDRFSYLDIFEDTVYTGSVQVRDRMLAFDIVNSTLVVLVERPVSHDDVDGVPDRAVDWYDIPASSLFQ